MRVQVETCDLAKDDPSFAEYPGFNEYPELFTPIQLSLWRTKRKKGDWGMGRLLAVEGKVYRLPAKAYEWALEQAWGLPVKPVTFEARLIHS
jgi:hypothetical protein